MCYLGSWGKLMTRDAATPLVITANGVLGRSRGWWFPTEGIGVT